MLGGMKTSSGALVLFLVACAAPPDEPRARPAHGTDVEPVTILDASALLPRGPDGTPTSAAAELAIDDRTVWRGTIRATGIAPEVLPIEAPRLLPGRHEFRLRVGERACSAVMDITPKDREAHRGRRSIWWPLRAASARRGCCPCTSDRRRSARVRRVDRSRVRRDRRTLRRACLAAQIERARAYPGRARSTVRSKR